MCIQVVYPSVHLLRNVYLLLPAPQLVAHTTFPSTLTASLYETSSIFDALTRTPEEKRGVAGSAYVILRNPVPGSSWRAAQLCSCAQEYRVLK
jgi:hypothetical protein